MKEKRMPSLSKVVSLYDGKISQETVKIVYRFLRERIVSLQPIVEENGNRPLVEEEDRQWDKGAMVNEVERKLKNNESTKLAFESCKDAWDRLISGTYGPCDVCGQAIGEDRIRAMPSTLTCKTCYGQKKHKPY